MPFPVKSFLAAVRLTFEFQCICCQQLLIFSIAHRMLLHSVYTTQQVIWDMNVCMHSKELRLHFSNWTPVWSQLRWGICNRVYLRFLEMSRLTLIPGSPGPPSCPRSPAGPLGPGGPGLPRSPAGPYKRDVATHSKEIGIRLNLKFSTQIHMGSPEVWVFF